MCFHCCHCHGCDADIRLEMVVRISVSASFVVYSDELCKYYFAGNFPCLIGDPNVHCIFNNTFLFLFSIRAGLHQHLLKSNLLCQIKNDDDDDNDDDDGDGGYNDDDHKKYCSKTFKWISTHSKNSFTGFNVRTTLYSKINSAAWKYCSISYRHMHTLKS